jgi:hypothetical protein
MVVQPLSSPRRPCPTLPVSRLAKMRADEEVSSDYGMDGSGEDEDEQFRHPDRARLVKRRKGAMS